jgi:hypothetical protein
MAGKIFINYRRGDDPGFAQALFARLEQAFRADQLFMDIDSIKPGLDFVRELEKQVTQSDVVLSVIGKGWIDARDAVGGRRLDNPHDYVRTEIRLALDQGKRVIPVLVGEAQLPSEAELPEEIRALATRNAVRLSHAQFKHEAENLFEVLKEALEEAESLRQAQAAQQKAEAEKKEKEKLGQTAAGLEAGDMIALQHWEFIKESNKPSDFEKFIKDFSNTRLAPLAQRQLDKMAAEAWQNRSDEIPALEEFVRQFPYDTHAEEAKQRIGVLSAQSMEAASWERIRNGTEVEAVEEHISRYPGGANARAARQKLEVLKRERDARSHWLAIAGATAPRPFEEFVELYPETAYAAQARVRVDQILRAHEEADWNAIRNERHPAPFLRFLKAHPKGQHAADASRAAGSLRQVVEQEAWAEVRDSDLPIALQAYIAAVPDGRNVKAARKRLQALTAGRAPPPDQRTTASTSSASATTADRSAPKPKRRKRVLFWTFTVLMIFVTACFTGLVISSPSNQSDLHIGMTGSTIFLGLTVIVLRLFGPRLYPSPTGKPASRAILFHAIGALGILLWLAFIQGSYQSMYSRYTASFPLSLVLALAVLLLAGISMRSGTRPWLRYVYYGGSLVTGLAYMANYPAYNYGSSRLNLPFAGGMLLALLSGLALLLDVLAVITAPPSLGRSAS